MPQKPAELSDPDSSNQHLENYAMRGSASQRKPSRSLEKNQRNYYEEYKKLYLIGYQMNVQLTRQFQKKQQLLKKVSELDASYQGSQNIIEEKAMEQASKTYGSKKRNRRMAEQIERKYKCSVEFCEKEYGSEGSLIQHIKLKHPEIYQPKQQ